MNILIMKFYMEKPIIILRSAFNVNSSKGSFSPKALSICKHISYINRKQSIINPTSSGNKLIYRFTLNKRSKVNLPVIAY